MIPNLHWERLTLHLRNPFRVSYGVSETRPAHWLRLRDDAGWGEGTIPPYYGISDAALSAYWDAAAQLDRPFPDDPAAIDDWVARADPAGIAPAPAKAAVDLALHDRIGRLTGRPLYDVLGLPRPPALPTSFTIGIDEPDVMAAQAAALSGRGVIKLKLGTDDDAPRVAAVRAARPDATLYVDANAAWSAEDAIRHIEAMLPYEVALVEQPVARDDFAGFGRVQVACPVPLVADESLQSPGDIERLAAEGVRGINLKLMKVGGLSPALGILRRARELGLGIMLGCMVETSLGATAMAHLAGLADWLDLDAPWLVANDPFAGLTYDEIGRVHIPDRPGIGVELRMANYE